MADGMVTVAHAGWLGELGSMGQGIVAEQERPAFSCAVHDCPGQGRLLFNGQRACSQPCLEMLLRAALIEEQTLATAAALRARPRAQLGRILIEQGTITEGQLEQALRAQRATGAGRLGCWLKQQVELPEADFAAALSIQWRCPVFRVGNFRPARMVSFLPRPLVEQHGALPLRLTGSPERLSLCFEDHVDYELMSAEERMHGIGVDAGLLTANEFWQGTRELLGVRFPRAVTVEAPSPDCMAQAMSRMLLASGAEQARMVAVHGAYWLRLWTAPSPFALSTEPLPHDVLCTPTGSSAGCESAEHTVDVLTQAMLRVLPAQR